MKNAFTKTLLCGVMATTFFLINCQKAPSRGIKGSTAAPGATTDASGKATTAEVLVECSPDFITKYDLAKKEVDPLKTQKLTDLSEAEKTDLIALVKKASEKTKEAIAELTKIDAKATGCVDTDAKTKAKSSPYLKANIEGALNVIVLKMKDQGIVIEGVTDEAEAAKEAAKRQRELTKNLSLSTDMVFVVSDQFAEVLKGENVGGVIYFKNGARVVNPSTESLEKDQGDLKSSMCQLDSGTNDYTKGEDLKVTNITKPGTIKAGTSKRYELLVTLVGGKSTVGIKCFIADGKQNESEKEFRTAFGKHIAPKEAKKEEKKEDKKEEAKKDTTVDEAKADLTKKTEALTAATQAAATAKQEYDAKLKEIDAAKEKQDKELATKLTEAAGPIKAKAEKAEADLKDAQKAKTDAEAALKKAESALAVKKTA